MSIDIKIPEIGESISEATLGQWLKEDGDYVKMDEIICEIESEKATMELTAEDSGVLNILVNEGETIKIGSVIGKIDTHAKGEPQVKKTKPQTIDDKSEDKEKKESPKTEDQSTRKTKLSPVAKKILDEAGIKPENIDWKRTEGKITKEDALTAIKQFRDKPEEVKEKVEQETTSEKITRKTIDRSVNRQRMTTLRKTIARRLLEARNGTAMLTTINEIDMTAIIEHRAKYKEVFKEKHGVRLGFMSFFTKAASLALNDFPVINASIDEDDIVYHNYHDIGIAVSTDRGLVVPVVRNVENLTMAQIEKEIEILARKATDNKLSIEEMSGGTFSITNGGIFGSLISTPIINTPQSAILGMHSIQDRPVARNGVVVVRPMMYIALSYDHRLIDGKESVQFVMRLKELLEDPIRFLFNV